MKKILRKVGVQDMTEKDSQFTQQQQTNFNKSERGLYQRNFNNLQQSQINRTKLDGSEYFNISEDSIRVVRKRKDSIQSLPKGKASVTIQFEKQEQSVGQQKRSFQILSMTKDRRIPNVSIQGKKKYQSFHHPKELESNSQEESQTNTQGQLLLSKIFTNPNYTIQQIGYHKCIVTESEEASIILQQTSGQQSPANFQLPSVWFQRAEEVKTVEIRAIESQNEIQYTNASRQNKNVVLDNKGITVRIKSGSGQKQHIFYGNQRSITQQQDSFMKHEWKEQHSLPNNKLHDFQKEDVRHNLLKSKNTSNSYESRFTDLKNEIMNDKIGNESERAGENKEEFEEEQVHQVIDLQSKDFIGKLNQIQDSFNILSKKQDTLKICEDNMFNPLMTRSAQPQLMTIRKQQIGKSVLKSSRQSLFSQNHGCRMRKKINLKEDHSESWGFKNSSCSNNDVVLSYQPIRQIIEFNQVQINVKEPIRVTSQKLVDKELKKSQNNFNSVQMNLKRTESKDLNLMIQSYQEIQEEISIDKAKKEKEEEQNWAVSKSQAVNETLEQQLQNLKKSPSNLFQEKIQLSNKNFDNLLEERLQMKASLAKYEKQIQEKNQKIYSMSLQMEKLQTDCDTFRAEIQTIQYEKEQLQCENQMIRSQLNQLRDRNQKKDQVIIEKSKQNQELKSKIESLDRQIQSLKKEIKQKSQKVNDSIKLNPIDMLASSRRQQNSLTGFFNENPTSDKKQTVLKCISTLSDLNNHASQFLLHSDEQNLENLNLSIQLNVLNNKRLLLNSRQAFAELQEYIFDLQQQIIFSETQSNEKIDKAVKIAECKQTEKLKHQIQQILQELQSMKAKYDKLKLWVKKYQQNNQLSSSKNTQSKTKIQEKSSFSQMIKNVTDFQQLFALFNQFNQTKNSKIPEPQQIINSSTKNYQQQPLDTLNDTIDLRQNEIILKRKEQQFDKMNSDIQQQWKVIEKEKRKCKSPPNNRNQSKPQVRQSYNSFERKCQSSQLAKRKAQKKYQDQNYIHRLQPYNGQNQIYLQKQFDKFSSQQQKRDHFQSSSQIQDSRSQRNLPNQKPFRYNSPQTEKNFDFQFQNLQSKESSKSPDFHNNYRQNKNRVQIKQPSLDRHEFRKTNKIFEGQNDISSRLHKLQKDIDTELRSIK